MWKLTTPQLMKVASFGGVFVIGNALLMRFLAQKRLHQSPYFTQAKDTVMANRALVEFLGKPISFGSVDLGDTNKNFSTSSQAQFEIPLRGSKQEGTLHLSSIRSLNATDEASKTKPYAGWCILNLEVTIKDKPNHKLILVKDSGVVDS